MRAHDVRAVGAGAWLYASFCAPGDAMITTGTGLLIVNAQDGSGIYFFRPEHGEYGWAGADYTIAGK
jgi:hypothetical protein